MLPKTFIFFAVSCLTAASASKFDDLLHSGNGNYIIQLNQSTCIKDFVPKFIDGAFEIFSQNFGGEHNFEKRNNRIVRRGTEADQVHIFDAYDIGHAFKAISVKFEELDIVKDLMGSFNHDILKIIPDEDVHVKLPKPQKSSAHKRYQVRAVNDNAPFTRAGNFNFEHLEHDENCTHNLAKRGSSKNSSKKRISKKTNKKSTYKKYFKTKKSTAKNKKITTKKTKKAKKAKMTNKDKNVTRTPSYSQQPDAEWNLARISQRRPNYDSPYVYSSSAGAETTVYILDDGLNVNHVEFGGRAQWGWSTFQGESPLGGGHGTHVAGTIGGKTFGIAKKTKLIAVQVLNSQGRGAISGFLAGLQWVADHRSKNGKGRSVINMSLGASSSRMPRQTLAAFNEAISAIVNEGIPIIAAAGNENADACNVIPASNEDVFTVAASGIDDDMSNYSNYGRCVQIIAPGTNIKSAYIRSTTSTTVMSGTSMASPHVAGVAALVMTDLSNPSPSNLYAELTKLATKDVISRVKSSTPNILLFNGAQQDSE